MTAKLSEDLARFAVDLDYHDLPPSALEHTRYLLVDAVACAIASDYGKETGIYTAFARAAGGAGDNTVIASSERLSLLGASLLNAYLITAATICDTYVPAHIHITPEVVPPALALAERDVLDGRTLLAAIAIGSEVAVRIAAGMNYAVAGARGWHMPGIVGPFGAAAAVGRLRGLSTLQMNHAFGLAGSQSAGTWGSWGSPAVKFHQSRGAASGLIAGLLAEQNLTASTRILEDPKGGIFATYSDGGLPEVVVDGLGERFLLEQISLRLWPGGAPLQPALTALFDLLGANQVQFDAVERVTIEVAPAVHEAHARFVEPDGPFDALLSFNFITASAIRDGQFWLDSVRPANLADPALRAFARERVEVVADPALDRERSRVALRMAGGGALRGTADAAKGTPGNPASADDLRLKFERAAAGRMAGADARELLDLLLHLDAQDDLSRLFQLLAGAQERAAAA